MQSEQSASSEKRSQTVEESLRDLRRQGRRAPSWSDLSEGWSRLVQAVEEGYSWNIYEYTNDLSVRDRIQYVLDSIDDETRSELETEVLAADARFLAASTAVAKPIAGRKQSRDWWWSQAPICPGSELEQDLAEPW